MGEGAANQEAVFGDRCWESVKKQREKKQNQLPQGVRLID